MGSKVLYFNILVAWFSGFGGLSAMENLMVYIPNYSRKYELNLGLNINDFLN